MRPALSCSGRQPAGSGGGTIVVYAVYLVFALIAAPAFRLWRPPVAALVVFVTGWLLLPVGRYPLVAVAGFPWWITGIVLPSDLLVTKAWMIAVVALAGAALSDLAALRRWRPSLVDLPMLGWCLWPLAIGLFAAVPRPAPLVSTLYLAASWGAPWLLGRIWFQGRAEQLLLIEALAWGTLACAPLALLEGAHWPFLYDAVYGPHPFRLDGVKRYVGYRPLGFFEDGNQYGIWVALGALAAVWLAVADRGGPTWRRWAAAGAVAIALASQSIGAVLLLGVGLGILALWRARWVGVSLVATGALVIAAGAVHVSGLVPIQTIVRDTPLGQRALAEVRRTGRGSLAWRVSQDTRTLSAVESAPLAGTQQWDWWRPFGTRPWGLALLLIGQFGLIGLALSWGTLAYAGIAALVRCRLQRPWSLAAPALPLGLVVLLALADGLLNAFFYFPALLAAGAIAERTWQTRRADARLAPVHG